MESNKDQNKGAESTSTTTPQPARGTMPPTTNLPPTISLELVEQIFKALRPDVDVAQTLAYLAHSAQPSTSEAAPATITTTTGPLPTAGELAGDEGREPEESVNEVVEEEEPPQGSNQPEVGVLEEEEDGATKDEARGITEDPDEDAAQAEREEGTAEGVSNPEQDNPEEVIPLQMDNFPGQPASALPKLSPPVEMSPPAEDVPLLEGPSRPDELQIKDPSCDYGAGKEEQRRERR